MQKIDGKYHHGKYVCTMEYHGHGMPHGFSGLGREAGVLSSSPGGSWSWSWSWGGATAQHPAPYRLVQHPKLSCLCNETTPPPGRPRFLQLRETKDQSMGPTETREPRVRNIFEGHFEMEKEVLYRPRSPRGSGRRVGFSAHAPTNAAKKN